MVIVGAESVVENGGIVSQIGTFQIAMIAKVREGVGGTTCYLLLCQHIPVLVQILIYIAMSAALLCWFRN